MKALQTVSIILNIILICVVFCQAQYHQKLSLLQGALQSQTELRTDQAIKAVLQSDAPKKIDQALELLTVQEEASSRMMKSFKDKAAATWIPMKFQFVQELEANLND